MAVVEGRVAGSDKFVEKREVAADTPPCSESMRTKFACFPISSVVEWNEVGGEFVVILESRWEASNGHLEFCGASIQNDRITSRICQEQPCILLSSQI
jgi:hypothetical protein